MPFVSFVANKAPDGQAANYSFVLRGYVRHWLGNVWAEFDRVKLIDMVAAGRCRSKAQAQPRGTCRPDGGRYPIGAAMQRRTPIFIVTRRGRASARRCWRARSPNISAPQSRPVAAFDVNPDEFTLVDHLPAYTAAASLDDTRGEMALFDQLVAEDQVPKVVDLGHALFDRFFTVMQEIDFAAEARRRAVAPMVLFVADPRRARAPGLRHAAGPLPRIWRWCRCSTRMCRRSRAIAPTFRRRAAAATRSTCRR